MPTEEENKQQIDRILASATFARHAMRRELLNRLAIAFFKGEAVSEYRLGIEIFDKPKDWVPLNESAVREGMVTLRHSLKDYYRSEGSDDLVLVEFPKYGKLRPRFSYNVNRDAAECCRRAAYRLHQTFPEMVACGRVVDELEACIRQYPSYALAHAMLAEVLLLGTLCDETYWFAARQSIPRASEAVTKCLTLNNKLWQAHVAAGALHCCRFQWTKANQAFETALSIAPDDVRAHFWYAAFLLAVGRTEEAKQCVAWRMKKMPEDRFTKTIRPLFLYVMREFKEAYDELTLQSPFFAHVASKFEYFCGDEIVPFDNWLTEVLVACLCLAQNHSLAAARYAEAGAAHSMAGSFGGLLVLATAEYARIQTDFRDTALNFLGQIENQPQRWHSPVSLALAYMGVGRTEEAIAKLKEACDDGHPLVVWLHLWPVFDPLREHQAFKTLIAHMSLPI